MESDGTYRIVTVCFDHEGNELALMGIAPVFDTGCTIPTFDIVKPAVTNTRVDMSPYGQSVFADDVDAVQAVDLTFDALINEVDVSKMRVFLSDVLFDREKTGDKAITIPFGKRDCTVFRKVMSTEDTIQEFAPALRTASQSEAFRIALQMLGDLCGFGLGYFDFDESRGFGGERPRRGFRARAVRRLHHPGYRRREGAGHARGGRHHGGLGLSRQVVRRGGAGGPRPGVRGRLGWRYERRHWPVGIWVGPYKVEALARAANKS